jgi:alpha-tubulin suppressor-like RCC1 family protein
MLVGSAIVGAQNLPNNLSQAANGWAIDNIQGNSITSSNNPGGYPNNTPSQSPDNGTNFSPAFGNSTSSIITINGSGFPMPDFNIDAKEVQGGYQHLCYLSNAPDSWLYCWGSNNYGKLGDGTTTSRATPVPISRGEISINETITAFSVGYEHSCAITNLDKTYCWGYNQYGSLGIGTSNSGAYYAPTLVQQGDLPIGAYFESISAGYHYTCAISNQDQAYCWGYGLYGVLGQSNTTSYPLPKKVKTISDGGSFVMPDNVKQISANINHTCAISSDNMVYCWGINSSGQIGDNTTTSRYAPTRIYGVSGTVFTQVEAAYHSTCALTDVGQIYCWGYNQHGELGNGTSNNSSVPILVAGGITFSKMGTATLFRANNSTYYYNFCAISDVGVGYCWGYGYLGNGGSSSSNIPIQIKTVSNGGIMPDSIVSITTFQVDIQTSNGCAVSIDSKLYCWGSNMYTPTVGDNTYTSRLTPSLVVQFEELPKIQFDDIYGVECQSIIVPTTSQLQCLTKLEPAQGLHDVIVTYHNETKVLPQSYMYKTMPNPPTNITAASKNKMIQLAWDWQSEKPYISSVSFFVECKPSSSSAWLKPTANNCDTSQLGYSSNSITSNKKAYIFGLQNGVSYDFRVQSYITYRSDYTYIYNVVPQASPYVPNPPMITSVDVNSANSGVVNWSAPQSDGGSPILGYILMQKCANNTGFVQRSLEANSSFQLYDYVGGNYSGCLSALAPAQAYVIAFNQNGASEPSEIITLQLNQPPATPTNIKVNNVSPTQTMLSWSAPSNNGSAITSYEMRYSTLPDFSDWTDTVGTDTCLSNTPSPPTTSCVSNSLTLGAKYYFQVRATNANGTSDWSIIHASVVGAPDRPIINNLSTTTINSATSSINVAWDPPNDNGAAITNYTLEYSTDPDFSSGSTTSVNISAASVGSTPNYTLTPADNGTIYYFRVLAANSRGESPWSDPVQAIPYAPPTITAISPNHGLTLGNELVAITGTNLNGTTSVKIDNIDCLTFSIINTGTINCLTPPNSTVGAKDVTVTNLGGSATLTGAYTYSDPQLTLNLDKVDLSIAFTNQFGIVKTDQQTATVKTDDPRGYILNLSMQSTETALIHTSLPSNKVATSTALVNAQPLTDNNWGYSLQTPSANQWLGAPPSNHPKNLKTTTNPTTGGMTGAGDSTTIYFGAKITLDQLAGDYAGRLVYTAVGNF